MQNRLGAHGVMSVAPLNVLTAHCVKFEKELSIILTVGET
jgi:hypothetical protein